MKNAKLSIILVILLSSLVIESCTKTYPEFDIPDIEQQVVVNSLFNLGEVFKVSVSLSQSRNTNNSLEVVENADVFLYENNLLVDTLVIRDDPSAIDSINRWHYYSKVLSQIKNQYMVVVDVPGFTPVYAISDIPEKAVIRYIRHEQLIKDQDVESSFIRIHIQLDSIMERGFYYFAVSKKRSLYSKNTQYILYEMNDPVLGQHRNSIEQNYCLFSGELLSSSSYNYFLDLDIGVLESHSLYFELLSLSEEAWLYLNSLSKQKNSDTRISEPVKVYSNINGGKGIFGGVNASIDSLLLK